MAKTLQIDGWDEDAGLYSGTIVVDGEPMRVWVPGDVAEGAPEGDRLRSADADDIPF